MIHRVIYGSWQNVHDDQRKICPTIGWNETLVGNIYVHVHVVNLMARLNIPIKTLTSKSLAALYVQIERYGMYYQVYHNNPGQKTINWEYS